MKTEKQEKIKGQKADSLTKVNKNWQISARLTDEKRQKTQITGIRSKTGAINTDPADINDKRILQMTLCS